MGDKRVDPYPGHPLSGQVVGLVTGTVYAFPDQIATRVILTAHPLNSGTAWVGNITGTVNNTDGFPLVADQTPLYLEGLNNLNLLVANFDSVNDRICWMLVRSYQMVNERD